MRSVRMFHKEIKSSDYSVFMRRWIDIISIDIGNESFTSEDTYIRKSSNVLKQRSQKSNISIYKASNGDSIEIFEHKEKEEWY